MNMLLPSEKLKYLKVIEFWGKTLPKVTQNNCHRCLCGHVWLNVYRRRFSIFDRHGLVHRYFLNRIHHTWSIPYAVFAYFYGRSGVENTKGTLSPCVHLIFNALACSYVCYSLTLSWNVSSISGRIIRMQFRYITQYLNIDIKYLVVVQCQVYLYCKCSLVGWVRTAAMSTCPC